MAYVIQRFTATVLVLSLTAAVFSQDKATETKLVALRIARELKVSAGKTKGGTLREL